MSEILQIQPLGERGRDGSSSSTMPPAAQPVTPPTAAHAPARNATSATSAQRPEASQRPTVGAVRDAVETLNNAMMGAGRSLRFDFDPESALLVVAVVDDSSGEVLRQLPAEEVVEAARRSRNGSDELRLLQVTA